MKTYMKKILCGVLILISFSSFNSAMAQKSGNKKLTYNKNLVLHFYQHVFGDKQTDHLSDYLLPSYIQHNPHVADGLVAFQTAAKGWFAKDSTKTKIDVQHIAAEGNLVFLHIKKPLDNNHFQSVVDIFRIEKGRIAEHWDVHENVPEKSANPHPMF